ncbi:MAG: YceD family protein [Steroidobacteraceae bacterium]
MPEDGSKLADVDALAETNAQVGLVVPVRGLERLEPLLASTEGTADANIAFRRERGQVVAAVKVSADLLLRCQRCLAPFVLRVAGASEVALVGSEAEVDRVPEEFETAHCPEGRIRLRELVEEELLLALPAAPMHPEGECGAAPGSPTAGDTTAPTQRPFAQLGEMLGGRDRRN